MTRDNLEFHYIQTQLGCNRWVRGVMENEIAQLMEIVRQKRAALREIEQMDINLKARAEAINLENKSIAIVDYNSLPVST